MLIEELEIPEYLKINLMKKGIRELYPPQSEAIKMGVLRGKNLVISTPTASGKTLIAILTASIHIESGGKVLYLTPLRAITSEKLREFKELLTGDSSRLVKIAATSGDYDSEDRWLSEYDVIICTNEKADSLIRHGANWMQDVTLVVADEIHVIGEAERGPTLEIVLTRLREMTPKAQILALSATIRNAEEIADWLGCDCLTSEWRPVPLKEGVYYDGVLEFADGESIVLREIFSDPTLNVAINTVLNGGQVLIFALSRRRAESYAERAAAALSRVPSCINFEEAERLREYADRLFLESDRSSFAKKLCEVMVRGSAFHHAGMSYIQRQIVEEAFRSRYLKILCATPTLAAGVNLPARTVIIPELWRYEPELGMHRISVMEYKQFCGRAGRPGYDDIGFAVCIARRKIDRDLIMDNYIKGFPERIYSRLASEKHLRTQVLAIIATQSVNDVESLYSFFSKTFFAYQYGIYGVRDKIVSTIDFLNANDMVKIDGKNIYATRLGKRVSELYIDPLTAVRLIESMSAVGDNVTDISILHMICRTPDIPSIPALHISMDILESYYEKHKDEFLVKAPDPKEDPDGYELYLDTLKNVIILQAWINEESEASMYDKYGIEPGDLAVLRERAEWVCYSAHEIAKVIGAKRLLKPLEEMVERIRHGVKPELIPLTRLEGIGRVRARALYTSGFRSIEDLKRASLNDLMSVPGIGLQIARKIKEQISNIP